VNVRPAASNDIPPLLALVRRYWEFEGIEGFPALRVELVLQRLLAEPWLGAVWVAESDGRLVGYLIAVLVLSVEHQGLMATPRAPATSCSISRCRYTANVRGPAPPHNARAARLIAARLRSALAEVHTPRRLPAVRARAAR
jgi:hypothetical protein